MENSSLTIVTTPYSLLSGRDIERLVWIHRALEGWIQAAQKIAEAFTINMEPIFRMVEIMRQWQEQMAVRIAEILSIAVPSITATLDKLPPVPPSAQSAAVLGLVATPMPLREQEEAVTLPANTYTPATAEGVINGKEFFFTNSYYKEFFAQLVENGSMTREEAFVYLGIKPSSNGATILLHESLKAIKKTTRLQGKLSCRGGRVYLKDSVHLKKFPKIP